MGVDPIGGVKKGEWKGVFLNKAKLCNRRGEGNKK